MTVNITGLTARDIRFPTSRNLDGSDAMNPDPDYSAAYVTLHTDAPGMEGNGLTFTIGRGNELCVAAIQSLAPLLVGKSLESFTANMGAFWRHITGDSQLRWVGPEKGVIHLATAAVVNAVWDLYAKASGKPLWRLLCDMTPEQLVSCIDFRYITDALTPGEATDILRGNYASRDGRVEQMRREGYPSYTTSAGWLGYSDAKLQAQCRDLMSRGWSHFKIKVGRDLDDDIRRCRIIREEIGWDRHLMMDANQVWDVGQSIQHMRKHSPCKWHCVNSETHTWAEAQCDVRGHGKTWKNPKRVFTLTNQSKVNHARWVHAVMRNRFSTCENIIHVNGVM